MSTRLIVLTAAVFSYNELAGENNKRVVEICLSVFEILHARSLREYRVIVNTLKVVFGTSYIRSVDTGGLLN